MSKCARARATGCYLCATFYGSGLVSWGKMRAKSLKKMVPAERIELPTFGLQNRCSTAELCRHTWARGLYTGADRC